MHLPKLKVVNEDKELVTCFGKDFCSTCQLFKGNGGRCDGCTPNKKRTLNENYVGCYRECNTCSGYKVQVPSICCRSPLKDSWMTAVLRGRPWNEPEWKLTARPRIEAKNKAVFYASAGSISTLVNDDDGYLVPEGTELVAVSLSRVLGAKRFASQDMHDYLRIPRKTKLVLLTMNKDDILEKAWETELYAQPELFVRVGFSYWMPLAFSAYDGDAMMQQYFQFLRTMYCTEMSEAWFFHAGFYRVGLRLDDLFARAIEKLPQVTFNAQFISDDTEVYKAHLATVRWFHQRCPAGTAFWLVGTATPTYMHNVRKLVGTRECFFISGNPHHHATQGKEMDITGYGRPSKLAKPEILRLNIKTFQQAVKNYG